MNGKYKSGFKVENSLFDEYFVSNDTQNQSQYNNEEIGPTISTFDEKSIENSLDDSSTKNSNNFEPEFDFTEDIDTLSLKSESMATFDVSDGKTGENELVSLKRSSEVVNRNRLRGPQNWDSKSDVSYEITKPKTGIDSSSLKLPTTLFIGNLGCIVTEPVLRDMYSPFGYIKRVEIYDNMTQSRPYCYIQFEEHSSARNARLITRGKYWFGQRLNVEWVFNLKRNTEIDSFKHFIVFVDHLSSAVDEEDLRLAFEPFGRISETSIGKYAVSDRSKGFGFVHFVRSKEAENAVNKMNGQLINCTVISYGGLPLLEKSSEETEDLDSVYFRSSDTNRTIVCKGLHRLVCIQIIRILFTAFGSIEGITIIEDKDCALIKYHRKLPAAQAIQMTNNTTFLGYNCIRSFWAQEQEEYIEDNDDIDQKIFD